ncbi:hypothetical protein B0H14DRAFT_2607367 [Mycena olivaceomarginata]|nr:hypothetical protein B0H14DRAFT_2607367 [Mycena olivaceomarginata]
MAGKKESGRRQQQAETRKFGAGNPRGQVRVGKNRGPLYAWKIFGEIWLRLGQMNCENCESKMLSAVLGGCGEVSAGHSDRKQGPVTAVLVQMEKGSSSLNNERTGHIMEIEPHGELAQVS